MHSSHCCHRSKLKSDGRQNFISRSGWRLPLPGILDGRSNVITIPTHSSTPPVGIDHLHPNTPLVQPTCRYIAGSRHTYISQIRTLPYRWYLTETLKREAVINSPSTRSVPKHRAFKTVPTLHFPLSIRRLFLRNRQETCRINILLIILLLLSDRQVFPIDLISTGQSTSRLPQRHLRLEPCRLLLIFHLDPVLPSHRNNPNPRPALCLYRNIRI